MNDRLASPLTVWLLLVGATAAAYLTQIDAAQDYPRMAGSVVLLLAFAKVWLIGMRYMELEHAPTPLRLAYHGWVITMAGALIVLFAQV